MLQYNTGISTTPPLSPQFRQATLAGLAGNMTPWAGAGLQNRTDNFSGAASMNAAEADRAAQLANDQFVTQARDIQSQLAQRGLQQMAQNQQNNTDLATRRYQTALDRTQGMFNNVNSLLSGLFQ